MDFTQKHFYPLCGSPIWDTKTVYSTSVDIRKSHSVDFTFCFEYTILKWCPCFVLWLVAPFWVYMLTRDFEHKLKFSLVSLLKFVRFISLVNSNEKITSEENRLLRYFLKLRLKTILKSNFSTKLFKS